MGRYRIEFYEQHNGGFPAEEFIKAQDVKLRAKLYRTIELLEIQGPELREPYSKSIGDGIFEIRAQHGTDAARILYFFVVDKRIILTNGFLKKAQKTPRSEIVLAKRYRQEFFRKERA